MPDHFVLTDEIWSSKCSRALNMAGLYMEGMQSLNMVNMTHKCLNMPYWPSVCWKSLPEKTVLTMPTFSICLIILDIWQGFKYASWIKYARVLNMWQYSYNSIITIANNVIVLQFLSTRFLHPSAPQRTILSLFLTTMTSELSKYLNEQLSVFLNVKQQKWN